MDGWMDRGTTGYPYLHQRQVQYNLFSLCHFFLFLQFINRDHNKLLCLLLNLNTYPPSLSGPIQSVDSVKMKNKSKNTNIESGKKLAIPIPKSIIFYPCFTLFRVTRDAGASPTYPCLGLRSFR